VLTACSATQFAHAVEIGDADSDAPGRSHFQSNVIRRDEMRARSVQSAYDAVMRLRPRFLTAAGHGDTSRAAVRPAAVIETGIPESIAALKSIPVDAVLEIRFIEPADAVVRFGARYTGGIVVVRLLPRRQTVIDVLGAGQVTV
jgi:hypothetical protein